MNIKVVRGDPTAEELAASGVSAVVNAARSISGRYPNTGPLILAQAGIPLVDSVGPLVMRKIREGQQARLEGDRVIVGEQVVAVGVLRSEDTILTAMEHARVELQFLGDG